MKNNKGQVLVIFLIFIPIFVFLVTFIVDYGTTLSERKNIESNIREAIKYGFRNIDDPDIENKLTLLIQNNIDNALNIRVHVKSDIITIMLVKKLSFLNQKEETVFSYIGTIENNKIIIKEE